MCKHRYMFLATTYNSLRLLRASRSRNLSLLFAYCATSSPFYAHNKAPPKLPGHLCASTGICSLLLLITHSDCYALRVPAICPHYSHIARLRRPFMLIIRHPRNFQDTFVQAQVSWKFRGLVSYMSFVSSSFSITKLFSFIIGFLSINPSISDGMRNNSSLDISVQYVFPYIPAIVSLIAPML